MDALIVEIRPIAQKPLGLRSVRLYDVPVVWAIKTEGNTEIPEIPKENRPALLFHYCSVEALDGIVRSHLIWLSDSRLQNDHRENTWILGHINSLRDEFDYSLPHFQRLFQHFELNAQPPYIAAFSTEGDLLSQWRAYASDGTGVCIGIDPGMVGAKFAVPVTGATTQLTLGIHPVIYDNDYQVGALRELFNRIGQKPQLIMDPASDYVAVEALNLRKWACVFKNPAFEEEREWRVIHTPLVLSHEDKTHPTTVGAVSEIAFRIRNGSIVSYFELPLPSTKDRSPIQHVVLGPKCQLDEQTVSLRQTCVETSAGSRRLSHSIARRPANGEDGERRAGGDGAGAISCVARRQKARTTDPR